MFSYYHSRFHPDDDDDDDDDNDEKYLSKVSQLIVR